MAAHMALKIEQKQEILEIVDLSTRVEHVLALLDAHPAAVSTPTVLTASTTVPQGYEFLYKSSSLKWYRIR